MGWGEAAEPSAAIVVRDLRAQLDAARELLDAYRELVVELDEYRRACTALVPIHVLDRRWGSVKAARARVAELEREGDGRG